MRGYIFMSAAGFSLFLIYAAEELRDEEIKKPSFNTLFKGIKDGLDLTSLY